MIVTCDIVESAAASSNQLFAEVDFTQSTVGFARDFLSWAISAVLVSSAVASDTAYLQPVGQLTDRAIASDVAIAQANYGVLIVEQAVARDAVSRTAGADITELAAGTDSMLATRATALTERANAGDDFVSSVQATTTIVERAVARDALLGFNEIDITDAAAGSAVATMSVIRTAVVSDSGVAHDTAIIAGDFADVLIDRAVGASSATSTVEASTTVTDSAVARDMLVLQLATMAWVMNTETFAMARYTALPFKSMAMVGGRVLGLGDGGLYELAGDTDSGAPVHASVVTGRSLLGSTSVKRIPTVYITGAVAGQLNLTAVVYGVHKGAFTYSMVARESDAPRGHRVQLGRGLASVYWKFIIENKDGARFDIDTIGADVAPSTTRRI